MPRLLILTLLQAGLASSLFGQTGLGTISDRARVEARQLLQGVSSSSFLDPTDVQDLALALSDIRDTIPQVRTISNHGDPSSLVLYLSDLGRSQTDSLPSSLHPDSIHRAEIVHQVGIASIDSVNGMLGVDSVEILSLSNRIFHFRPYFSRIPNVPVLAPHYQRLPEISYAGPEIQLGGGDAMIHFRKDGLWYFVFSRGSGDCPAGCIKRDYYYVTYAPAEERARLVDVLMDGQVKQEAVNLWDIPSRLSVMPYTDYQDLRSQLVDSRWWVRHHAVAVLDYILRNAHGPWRGDGSQDSKHFERIQRSVHDHRLEILLLLSDRTADADEWVRSMARSALVHVSGTDLGEGEAARAHWRAWVEREEHRPRN